MNVKRKNNLTLLIFLLYFSSSCYLQAQSNTYSILFYNIENLFDCSNDSLTNDEEFTPQGYKHWTYNRLNKKLNGISKTILAINKWDSPDLIGLCEVENAQVLYQLIYNTGLNHLNYKFIHFNSSDRRGIDVALLYRSDHFEVLSTYPIKCSEPENNFYTRDALYTKGVINNSDTLHLIINHWPSKRGGELASESKRIKVAERIRTSIDSIFKTKSESKIILLGDFNADLSAKSLKLLTQTNQFHSILDPDKLATKKVGGSHKYQGHWSLIDHILVSNSIAMDDTKELTPQIGQLPYLLESDNTYSGVKPKRTYAGPRYIGGVSDHLPIMLSIKNKVTD